MALQSGSRDTLTYNIALEAILWGGRGYHDSELEAKDDENWGLGARLLQLKRSIIV